jgi:ankyrin repeat protein
MSLEFSGPLSRKRLAFSIQVLLKKLVPKTPNASYAQAAVDAADSALEQPMRAVDCCRRILQNDAGVESIDLPNSDGDTALFWAVKCNQMEIVEILLEEVPPPPPPPPARRHRPRPPACSGTDASGRA